MDVKKKKKKALRLYQKVLDKIKQILGPNHPYTLTKIYNIASVLD